jgi:hypothetical protein
VLHQLQVLWSWEKLPTTTTVKWKNSLFYFSPRAATLPPPMAAPGEHPAPPPVNPGVVVPPATPHLTPRPPARSLFVGSAPHPLPVPNHHGHAGSSRSLQGAEVPRRSTNTTSDGLRWLVVSHVLHPLVPHTASCPTSMDESSGAPLTRWGRDSGGSPL